MNTIKNSGNKPIIVKVNGKPIKIPPNGSIQCKLRDFEGNGNFEIS